MAVDLGDRVRVARRSLRDTGGLAVNIALLAFGLTKTLNIDLWNYWHIAFTGALVAIVTGSTAAGLVVAGIHMVILLALADWSAPLV